MNKKTSLNLEPRTGKEVVEIISKVYDLLDPTIASALVNPNVVLAIAGIKSCADIHWIRYTKNADSQVDNVNKVLRT